MQEFSKLGWGKCQDQRQLVREKLQYKVAAKFCLRGLTTGWLPPVKAPNDKGFARIGVANVNYQTRSRH